MTKHVIKIFKGSLIGVGLILPGISGAMIATILFIYQDLIIALNLVTKHPIKAITSIWQYLLGVILGIIISVVFIDTYIDVLLLPLTFLFIGFIIGGIPKLIKDASLKHAKKSHYATFVSFGIIMFLFMFLNEQTSVVSSFLYYIALFVVGLLTAISMIIPGLSGATILMALGFYDLLIDVGSAFITGLLNFDLKGVLSQLPMLTMIALGAIVGLIGIGKLVYFLLKQHKRYFYFGVLGVVVVSPINILYLLNQEMDLIDVISNVSKLLISFISLSFGFLITHILMLSSKNKGENI